MMGTKDTIKILKQLTKKLDVATTVGGILDQKLSKCIYEKQSLGGKFIANTNSHAVLFILWK